MRRKDVYKDAVGRQSLHFFFIFILLMGVSFGSFTAVISSDPVPTDTLQSVTDRGSVTDNEITINNNLFVDGTAGSTGVIRATHDTYHVNQDVSVINARFPTNDASTYGSMSMGRFGGGNRGVGLRFQQVEGVDRLLFRGSATPGAMVWKQPEIGAQLLIDIPQRSFKFTNSLFTPMRSNVNLGGSGVNNRWKNFYLSGTIYSQGSANFVNSVTANSFIGDGSQLYNVTENDTLQSVTDRGAVTDNEITINNNLTVNDTVYTNSIGYKDLWGTYDIFDVQSGSLYDLASDAVAITWFDDHLLFDTAAKISVDFSNKRLENDGTVIFDWKNSILYNTAGGNRVFEFSDDQLLYDYNEEISIDIANRELRNSFDSLVFDWQNSMLYNPVSGDRVFSFADDQVLYGNFEEISIDLVERKLIDIYGDEILKWYNTYLITNTRLGIGTGTVTPNQKLQVVGNINASGTVYASAFESHSPIALGIDSDVGYTRLCYQATNGDVVLESIQLVNGNYQPVYNVDTQGICDKNIIKESYSVTEFSEVKGEIKEVKVKYNTYEKLYSKQQSEEIIKTIRDALEQWQSNITYNQGDIFQYNTKGYEVIKEHTSQEDWLPNTVPALYKTLILHEYNEITEWVQPQGLHDCYPIDAQVTYDGQTYQSTDSCNVWQPPIQWSVIE